MWRHISSCINGAGHFIKKGTSGTYDFFKRNLIRAYPSFLDYLHCLPTWGVATTLAILPSTCLRNTLKDEFFLDDMMATQFGFAVCLSQGIPAFYFLKWFIPAVFRVIAFPVSALFHLLKRSCALSSRLEHLPAVVIEDDGVLTDQVVRTEGIEGGIEDEIEGGMQLQRIDNQNEEGATQCCGSIFRWVISICLGAVVVLPVLVMQFIPFLSGEMVSERMQLTVLLLVWGVISLMQLGIFMPLDRQADPIKKIENSEQATGYMSGQNALFSGRGEVDKRTLESAHGSLATHDPLKEVYDSSKQPSA